MRLVKQLKGLEKLIQTLKFSLSALGNILILFLLLVFIFSIMGCYLFIDVRYSDFKDKFDVVNEYYNFDNFYYAFLMVFRATSGESWPDIMLEYANFDNEILQSYVPYIYFIGMIFMCSVIMLNLFVLVVLQQYDEFHKKEENPIERFTDMLDKFKQSWNAFSTEEDNGERINSIKVTDFLIALEGDLALELEEDIKKKEISSREKHIKEKVKLAIMDMKFLK